MPIEMWYNDQAEIGRALNYGVSVAWTFARVVEMNPEMGEPDATLSYFQKAFGNPDEKILGNN